VSQSRLNEVFVSHRPVLLRTLQRIVSNHCTAEDLLHETYLRVDGALRSRVVEHIKPFIFQTARNLALDHLRARRVRDRTLATDATDLDMESVVAPIPTMEDMTHAERMLDGLSASLTTLTRRQQLIFSLSRLDGCSYAEIATQLGVSASTVQKDLKLAMTTCLAVAARLNPP
jgi:RNA polymerase sigma factor (sigma-70 family)